MTSDYDSIALRLPEILRRLNEGEKLKPSTLAQEFGVTLRTIQRDLKERFEFLELEKKDGCYSINRLRLGSLSMADVQRFASLAGLQGLHPKLSTEFLRDILDSRIQNALLVRGHNYEELDGKEPLFNQLKHAIEQTCTIGFEYRKPDGPKMVEGAQPYRLVNQDGIWYLAAMDAGQLKSYAFSKIDRLLVSPHTFTPDPAVVNRLNEEDSIWLNLHKTEVVL
jgi:predicted DNA-binding transcriptional regulator YafY